MVIETFTKLLTKCLVNINIPKAPHAILFQTVIKRYKDINCATTVLIEVSGSLSKYQCYAGDFGTFIELYWQA